MVEWLFDEGADVEAMDQYDRASLYHANRNGHPLVVSLLLSKGSDINHQDESGWTSLMTASKMGRLEVVQVLLGQKDCNLDLQRNLEGTGPFMISHQGHSAITKLVVEKGADPTIADNEGRTPLDTARQRDHLESAPLLEDALSQPILVRLLYKLRSVHDAEHAITKAYNDAEGRAEEERKRKAIAAAPAYLKRRVRKEEELPAVAVNENGEEEVKAEVLKHVVMRGKVSKEMFIEMMIMMLPKWDEERKRT